MVVKSVKGVCALKTAKTVDIVIFVIIVKSAIDVCFVKIYMDKMISFVICQIMSGRN